jgi:hypothetical protein
MTEVRPRQARTRTGDDADGLLFDHEHRLRELEKFIAGLEAAAPGRAQASERAHFELTKRIDEVEEQGEECEKALVEHEIDWKRWLREDFRPLQEWRAEWRGSWRLVTGFAVILGMVATFFSVGGFLGWHP